MVSDRFVVGLLFLSGWSSAGHGIFEFVIEVLCFCVVGRVEGLFPVCLVSVYRVLVPVAFLLSPLLLCVFAVFFAGRSISRV